MPFGQLQSDAQKERRRLETNALPIIAPEQPIETNLSVTEHLFVKHYHIKRAGTMLPQHAHNYDHVTVVAAGGISVWQDGEWTGHHRAPASFVVPANRKHAFRTMTDDTMLLCIHRADFEVTEEHQIVEQY